MKHLMVLFAINALRESLPALQDSVSPEGKKCIADSLNALEDLSNMVIKEGSK